MDTIGDAYVVVAGIEIEQSEDSEHPSETEEIAPDLPKSAPRSIRAFEELLSLALLMQRAMDKINKLGDAGKKERLQKQNPLSLRVGIAQGHVIAGVMGSQQPRFQFFGPALTLAERFQRLARPGDILVQRSVSESVPPEHFHFSRYPTQAHMGDGELGEYKPVEDARLLLGESCEYVPAGSEMGAPCEARHAVWLPKWSTQPSLPVEAVKLEEAPSQPGWKEELFPLRLRRHPS